jgi:hypothetical protein
MLMHPGICTLFEFNSDAGIDYLAFELLPGETLASRLARGPLPLDEALARAIDIAQALAYAHARGVIHRRLKPANVVLMEWGTKVLDFGLARIIHGETDAVMSIEDPTPSESDMALGSVPYMAPEQIDGRVADARADIFAFGTTLYEMLTGRRAFAASSPAAVIDTVVHGPTPSLAAVVPGLPAELDHLVRSCLQPDPDVRTVSLGDVAQELARIRERAATPFIAADAARPTVVRSTPRAAEVAAPANQAPRASPPAAAPTASPRLAEGMWSRLRAGVRALGRRIAGSTPSDRHGDSMAPRPSKRQASTGTGASPTPSSGGRSRPVLLGVSAPRAVGPGQAFTAVFAAYIQEAEAAVRQQMMEMSGATLAATRTLLGLAPAGRSRWAVGTPVLVRITGDHIVAQPASISFEWNGERNEVAFLVRVNAAAPKGTTHLCFEAFIGAVPVAFVPVPMHIGEVRGDAAPETVTASPFSTAFASYASGDAAQVTLGVSWLKRWDAGLDVFLDCLDLNPNERWQRELESVIPARDVFLLFWSVRAMNSPWVRWELQTAWRCKPRAIRPMPLDDPEIAPPPEELKDLQFRDRYLVARQAFLGLALQKERDHRR